MRYESAALGDCLRFGTSTVGDSVLPASSYNFLHDGTESRLYLVAQRTVAAGGSLLATTYSNTPGIRALRGSTSLIIRSSDGSTTTSVTNASVSNSPHLMVMATSALSISSIVYTDVDKDTQSAVIANSASDAERTLQLGRGSGLGLDMDICEMIELKKPAEMLLSEFNERDAELSAFITSQYSLFYSA